MKSSWLYFFFVTFAFPLFYFVYKFGDPDIIAHDFYHYYGLYQKFDVVHAKSPFNMRVVGAFFIFLIYKAGFYYDTQTRFDTYANYMQEEVWFAAVFFNFLMVAGTATLISKLYTRFFEPSSKKWTMHALLAGCIYLLGYGTLFFDLMPTTEAFSTFLFTCLLWLFLKRSYLLLPVLSLCVFQREFLIVLMLVLALFYQDKVGKSYYNYIAMSCGLLIITYFLIRRTWFYNPELHHQTSIVAMLEQMKSLGIDISVMIRQSLISLNLLLLYFIIIGYKYVNEHFFNKKEFHVVLIILLVSFMFTLAGGLGTNFGRLFYLASPLVACLLVKEAAGLTVSTGQSTGN